MGKKQRQKQQRGAGHKPHRASGKVDVCLTCLRGEVWCLEVGEVGHVSPDYYYSPPQEEEVEPEPQPQEEDGWEALLRSMEFAMVFLLFAAVVAYFLSWPPLPPSVAAASQRLSYRSSFCRFLSNFRFLMIALAYSMPLGILAGWSGVLDMILTPAKVSQVDAGWIRFWSTVGGCVVGIGVARFADSMRGMLKFILLLMFSGATLSSTWLTLTCLPDSGSHLPLTTGKQDSSGIRTQGFNTGYREGKRFTGTRKQEHIEKETEAVNCMSGAL
ncbi:UNVERIFIED_CONTAM: hypothetical protein FKN15_048077 [Acipenser sinensis]